MSFTSLKKVSEQVKNQLFRGYQSRDEKVDISDREVIEYLRNEIAVTIKETFYELKGLGNKAMAEHYVHEFELPLVKKKEFDEIEIPVPYNYIPVTSGYGQSLGVQRVQPISTNNNVSKPCIICASNILDMFNGNHLKYMEGHWVAEVQKQKIRVHPNCNKKLSDYEVEKVLVQIVSLGSAKEADKDDPLYLPPETVNLIINRAVQHYAFRFQKSSDMNPNTNPDE